MLVLVMALLVVRVRCVKANIEPIVFLSFQASWLVITVLTETTISIVCCACHADEISG